ncbi:OmpA family protein [Marinomonas rhizomae]|uniref:OmpA family protein n=1 Tax=Marinomonas rhizomae TaxID=491948 RepID=UPI00210410E9|nr:OmpA family protein [Marinomonas rhizomae]UTV99895.1 OmpA family protein [Marinomonas rhizomae]
MSFTIAKRTLLSSIIAASSISTMALAQQEEGFTLTPSIGYYNFDNERGIKNDKAYSLGLGYQFNNPWAVEFVYLNADSKQSGSDVDVDQYRLDGLYHLPTINSTNLTPYLAAGVGTADFSNDSGHDNIHVNAGGGLKYAVNDTVSLRADFRLVDDIEDHQLDNVTSLGVQMTFGGPSKSSTTNDNVYAKAEPVAVEPEPIEQVQPVEETPQQPEVVAPEKINIQFGLNNSTVEQKFYPKIEEIASFLKDNPESTVVIEGHADDTGAASYNQTLSEKRAKAISDILVRTFEISELRIDAIGYGEERPFVENDTEAHRAENRRAVAIISTSEA